VSTFLTALAAQRLLPVLRTDDPGAAVTSAQTAIEAGLRLVELTATTPDWARALAQLRQSHPEALIGLGTVTSGSLARAAVAAGASFLVSPWPVPEVRTVADEAGVPFLEGAFSPAEVAGVARRGPVKLFPAHMGGPAYVRSLRQVLPDAVLVPTGGIRLSEVETWLESGATAVGVGRDLFSGDLARHVADVLAIAIPSGTVRP